MATYYDGLNYIYRLFADSPPPSSAQLVILHLLHENNRCKNTGTVQISDRELGLRTRLSKQTITDAKRTLKNLGLIDFKTDKDKPNKVTIYTLKFFFGLGQKVGQTLGQELGQELGQKVGQPADVPITHVRGDLRLKTEENTYANAGAKTEEIDELLEYWGQAGGCKLNQLLVSKLDALLKAHGLPAMKSAIDKANDGANSANYGFSLEYVRNKLPKGGDNNDRKVLPFANRKLRIEYKEPEYTDEERKQLFGVG